MELVILPISNETNTAFDFAFETSHLICPYFHLYISFNSIQSHMRKFFLQPPQSLCSRYCKAISSNSTILGSFTVICQAYFHYIVWVKVIEVNEVIFFIHTNICRENMNISMGILHQAYKCRVTTDHCAEFLVMNNCSAPRSICLLVCIMLSQKTSVCTYIYVTVCVTVDRECFLIYYFFMGRWDCVLHITYPRILYPSRKTQGQTKKQHGAYCQLICLSLK